MNEFLNSYGIWFSLVAVIYGVVGSWFNERKAWNKGICNATGKPWVKFMTTNSGHDIYTSDEHKLEIRFPFTRR